MKTCPQCRTKYTDDTLKFCLQDGSRLLEISEEKTEVFDQEAFANEKTIAENVSDQTQNYTGKTEEMNFRQTNEKTIASNDLTINQSGNETVTRQRNPIQTDYSDETPNTKKSSGFLVGILIGLLLIGITTFGVLAFMLLPEMLADNSNVANTNSTNEKIISDSEVVKVSASSSRRSEKGNFYMPELAFDGNSRTAWAEGANGSGIGQWIVFDFKQEMNLKSIIIEPGYFKTEELWRKNNRISMATIKLSDGTTKDIKFPDELKSQTIEFENKNVKSVMITIKGIYPGQTDSEDTLISEVKFVVE